MLKCVTRDARNQISSTKYQPKRFLLLGTGLHSQKSNKYLQIRFLTCLMLIVIHFWQRPNQKRNNGESSNNDSNANLINSRNQTKLSTAMRQ